MPAGVLEQVEERRAGRDLDSANCANIAMGLRSESGVDTRSWSTRTAGDDSRTGLLEPAQAAAISYHHEIGDRQPRASIQSASRQSSTCGPIRRILRSQK